MNNIYKCITCSMFLSGFLYSLGVCYPWPVNPFNEQHGINGTLGECRDNRDHFHKGVDVEGSSGTNVYPVVDGIVTYVSTTGINAYVEVTDNANNVFKYQHIDPIVKKNDAVTASVTILGTIKNIANPHLHFEDGLGSRNPLRNGALTPFVDNTNPVINSVDIYKQGTNEQFQSALYGKIDLWVNAYDPRTTSNGGNAGGNCGIYKIIIKFLSCNQPIGDSIVYHIYNSVAAAPITDVFTEGSTSTNFIYNATNDPFHTPYDKYWNSKQQRGEPYNVDAIIPSQAMYNEGHMQIRIIVEDIQGNSDTLDIGH